MSEWLRIDAVQKTVDEFRLGPIDLMIEPGTITVIAGMNGSGKSTLLKLIMGLAKLDHGRIIVGGKPVGGADEDWKQHITYVPQKLIGWDPYTGEALKGLIAPLYGGWDEELFQKIIKSFNIPLSKRFGKMSPGLQQKLALALALPRGTRLMILDEPMNSLDIPSRKGLTDLLADWMEVEERAILMTSHQVEDIRKLADFIFLMQNGETLGHYEKEQLTESYRRYWIDRMPDGEIPEELARGHMDVVTAMPEAAEQYFEKHGINVMDQSGIELEEIISYLLDQKPLRRVSGIEVPDTKVPDTKVPDPKVPDPKVPDTQKKG
ncbi:ABC transporter ATP-binding protein [Planomicrobium sp. YIM 101495]|uniref:ATP-binding cassette domain-containing protein n=1 Tax=Planomicrobium sp. YIM 101495 TaxID=2665160 RepID=UPI0012B8B802|nr:ABC transporter ATP-binding protein [Planomicrobium sp. YIM 101495]MTD31990.1 ATP-binding cassette domain-containing protein [Planomicrobium sp. YIM 101495]